MAVEPVDVVAYTLTIELPATASFDCVTLDHTTSSLTSQFTTSWPTTITDNATDYHSTIFPKPTGACFLHPTYLHLHWTNRQSTPTFPPQPPTPSRPWPFHSDPIAPPSTSTAAPHAPDLWTHSATNNPPPTAPPS